MLSGNVLLDGAPDAFIGPEGNAKAVQVMHLEMSNDVLEELLESVRRGKQPHVVFGRNPVCCRPFLVLMMWK
jgi:RNA polymerase II elongation factor ELL